MKKTATTKTTTQVADLDNQLKRALADYANLKKRQETDKLSYLRFAAFSLFADLLPVLDNLILVQSHLKDDGLKLAIDSFKSVLSKEGISEIPLVDTTFDPNLAECTELVVGPKDQVVAVVKAGYQFNDQVLRPAQVKVGKGE